MTKKRVFKDYHGTVLSLDDEVVFTDPNTDQFITGTITEFRQFAIGIQPNTFQRGVTTFWRKQKEVIKVCQP